MSTTVRQEHPGFTLGDHIKKAREEAGLRQPDLAQLINVSVRTLSAWENDEGKGPSVRQYRDVATATGADWLLDLGRQNWKELLALAALGAVACAGTATPSLSI